MKLSNVMDQVETNFSPHAWERLTLKLIPKIKELGFQIHEFKGDIDVDNELVTTMDNKLKEMYGKGLVLN